MPLRARVDRHRCIGAGTCITIAPTAFDWHEGDFAKAGVVDPSSVEDELLREAALACPTGAITVEEVEELLPWQLRGKEAPAASRRRSCSPTSRARRTWSRRSATRPGRACCGGTTRPCGRCSPSTRARRSWRPATGHPVQVPPVGDALQLVLAGVLEAEAGARNQVSDRLRDQDLGRGRKRRDPRADIHGDPSDLAADRLDLARVHPAAYLEPEVSNRFADRLCAPDAARGAVERGEEPVAGRVDLGPAEPAEERSNGAVMTFDEIAPAAVAELRGLRRRPDDVGEHHGREHAVEVGLLVADLRHEPLDLVEQLVLVP